MVAARKINNEPSQEATPPRALALAAAGVVTGQDFATLMSALMSDVIEGRIDPVTANSVCTAGARLLKVVEMQYKYAAKEPRPTFNLLG